jgi:hypothetical protein
MKKKFATKTPRHEKKFYNKIFRVPLCLSAFVAKNNRST